MSKQEVKIKYPKGYWTTRIGHGQTVKGTVKPDNSKRGKGK